MDESTLEQIKQVTKAGPGFAAEMREKGIHVGLGPSPRCVTCDEVWPCKASTNPNSKLTNGEKRWRRLAN